MHLHPLSPRLCGVRVTAALVTALSQRSEVKVASSNLQAGWENLGVESQQEVPSLPWTDWRRVLQHSRVSQAKQKKVKAAEISVAATSSCKIHSDPNNGSMALSRVPH